LSLYSKFFSGLFDAAKNFVSSSVNFVSSKCPTIIGCALGGVIVGEAFAF